MPMYPSIYYTSNRNKCFNLIWVPSSFSCTPSLIAKSWMQTYSFEIFLGTVNVFWRGTTNTTLLRWNYLRRTVPCSSRRPNHINYWVWSSHNCFGWIHLSNTMTGSLWLWMRTNFNHYIILVLKSVIPTSCLTNPNWNEEGWGNN